jgi:hypothetical protein
MEEFKDLIWIVVAVAIWLIQVIAKAVKAQREAAELRVVPPPPPAYAPPATDISLPTPLVTPAEEQFRRNVLQGIAEIEGRAAAIAGQIKRERPNRRFLPVLERWVPLEAARLRQAVAGPVDRRLVAVLDALATVVNEIDELCRQRRDASGAAELGDADNLADACYAPIISFCQAEGLPLTTARPATQLTDFDLAIWTGFIPTQVAPIFLPPDFFRRIAWWPAIAHEIGHDFLHSLAGFDARLRMDLGLPSEEVGTRPLGFGPQGVTQADFDRVLAGWLEELFCDVFSTMMCGPAYVATMNELFAARNDPREILVVDLDESSRRYDMHPPRHLRHLAGCAVLERMGFHGDAKRLRQEWTARHTSPDGRGADRLLFPMGAQLLAIPLDAFTPGLERIVERIVAGPLSALSQFGLEDVPGLDYGPHEHAEAERARSAFRKGRVPTVRDPRAVISGAVLAALEAPELEDQILRLAREAIPAIGTLEHRHDVYDPAVVAEAGGLGQLDAAVLRDAVVLRAMLQRR